MIDFINRKGIPFCLSHLHVLFLCFFLSLAKLFLPPLHFPLSIFAPATPLNKGGDLVEVV